MATDNSIMRVLKKDFKSGKYGFGNYFSGSYITEELAEEYWKEVLWDKEGKPHGNNVIPAVCDGFLPSPIILGEDINSTLKKGMQFWRIRQRTQSEMDTGQIFAHNWRVKRGLVKAARPRKSKLPPRKPAQRDMPINVGDIPI